MNNLKQTLLEFGLTSEEADATIEKVPLDILIDAIEHCGFKTKSMLKTAIRLKLRKLNVFL